MENEQKKVPMEINLIGSKIVEARKKMNISQSQLAERLFISPQAVGKWERGESIPDIITLNRLSMVLGVDLNYLLGNFQSTSDERDPKASEDHVETRNQKQEKNAEFSQSSDQKVQINLNAVDLKESDFSGVILHNGKFKVSPLQRANFANADLTGSSFKISDAREANFDGANLTDCTFSIFNLTGASFNKSILVRTTFDKLGMDEATFIDVRLIDVKLIMTDLRKTVFQNCIFDGVHFKTSDLRGMNLDGQTFINVKFDKSSLNNVSFKGATFRNVSIVVPFSVTNKSYKALQTINFEGAKMDKVTYAALKAIRMIDLSKVTVI